MVRTKSAKTCNNNTTFSKSMVSEISYKTSVPCNAVYPKKKPLSRQKSVKTPRSSEKYLINDDIGIRLYRKAVEDRNTKNRCLLNKNDENPNHIIKRSKSLTNKNILYSEWDLTWLTSVYKVEDRFEKNMREQAQKRMQERENFEKTLKEKCTFKPKINANSSKIARHAKSFVSENRSIIPDSGSLIGETAI